ncbi:ABC transporter permease [Halorhabdus amylolytica]|uniref:ABC transporter permease n=1 Tax=Halorhabdus amylolytica TaxID=2559573 RepID=UPI0010AB4598|nr:ABC transporter permease [Halorhabdus amylolytica]
MKRIDGDDHDAVPRDDGSALSDGGQRVDADSPFRAYEVERRTRRQRWAYKWDLYVASPLRVVWSDWRTRVGVLIVVFYLLMGTVGVVLVPPPETNQGALHTQPFQTMAHPLGTDGLGQDMISLIVHATPPMLEMMLSGGVFATGVATVLGTLAGYRAGRIDSVLTTVMDMATAIPGLPLAIVVATILQPESPWVVGIVLTINVWAGLGRSIRSQVLTLRESDYVEASRTMRIRTPNIIARDIVPNIMPYITINFVNAGRIVIFSSVALYFLGVLPFTNTHWGVTMNRAYRNSGALYSLGASYTLLIPMIAIIVLSLGLVLLSQGADRIFNPRVRARRSKTISDSEDPGTGGAR